MIQVAAKGSFPGLRLCPARCLERQSFRFLRIVARGHGLDLLLFVEYPTATERTVEGAEPLVKVRGMRRGLPYIRPDILGRDTFTAVVYLPCLVGDN